MAPSATGPGPRTPYAKSSKYRRPKTHRRCSTNGFFGFIGYQGKEANVRARVMYYHQVGYYAMGVRESQRERRALIPYYRKVLTGRDG